MLKQKECLPFELLEWIELDRDEENFLSTLAERENVIKSLFEKIINNLKNDLLEERISLEEAKGAKYVITKLRKQFNSYK